MPIPTDTFWSIRRLNWFFAFSAVLLLAIMGWSIIQDYDETWREPQRNTRIWEAALIDETMRSKSPEWEARRAELQAAINAATAARGSAQHNTDAIQSQILALVSQAATIEFSLNNVKSNLIVAEAALQDAQTAGDKEQVRRLRDQLATMRAAVLEQSERLAGITTEIQEKKNELAKGNEEVAQLEKELKRLETEREGLKKKRNALIPNSIPAKFSAQFRATPLMGFVNPTERVQQIVLPDVQTDVSFMKITTIDRCTTCHVNIDKKDFALPAVLTFLERQVAADVRGLELPADPPAKATDPAATADAPGAAAMPEFWHAWAVKLAPEVVRRNAARLKTLEGTIGKGVTVRLDGKVVNQIPPAGAATAEQRDLVIAELIKAWAQFEKNGADDAVAVKATSPRVTVEITNGAASAGPARVAALKYPEEARAALEKELSKEQRRILLDRYRRALLAELNAYRVENKHQPLDPSRVLLAHPRLDLYADIDSKHNLETVGCTSCHDGSGQETDFVLAAHTARDIWVDDRTGEPVLASQLTSPPPAHDTPTLSSMLAAVFPETALAPLNASSLHLSLDQTPATHAHGAPHPHGAPDAHGVAEPQTGSGHVAHVVDEYASADARPTPYRDPVTGKTGRAVPQIQHWADKYEAESGDAFDHVHHRWDWPMRPMKLIEANCARCHTQIGDIREEAPIVNEGRTLFANIGCANCHQMDSIPEKQRRQVGPELRHVTAKLSPEFLNTWIWAPKAFRPSTKMPHFFMLENNSSDEELRRTRQEARAITEYLVQTATPLPQKYQIPPTAKGSAEAGRTIFESVGCQGCHVNLNNPTKSKGVNLGQMWLVNDLVKEGRLATLLEPEIRGEITPKVEEALRKKTITALKKKLKREPTPEEIEAEVADDLPKELDKETEKELKKRVTASAKELYEQMTYNERHLYLAEKLEPPPVMFEEPTYPDGTKKPIFMQHGPELSSIGTKLLAGRTEEQARQWLFQWLKEPDYYSSHTLMPDLRLTDQQALDLMEYLLAQKRTNDKPDDTWKASLTPPDPQKLAELTSLFLRSRYSINTAQLKAKEEFVTGPDGAQRPGEMTLGAIDALTTPATSKAQAEEKVAEMDLTQKQLVFLGKKLISHYGCMSCHQINGLETVTSPCANLSDWGQKSVDKLDYAYLHHHKTAELPETREIPMVNGLSEEAAALVEGKLPANVAKPVSVGWPHVDHSRDAWIIQKLKNTRIYDRGKGLLDPRLEKVGDQMVHDPGKPYDKLRMPTFYLSNRQVNAIVTFVLSNRDRLITEKMQRQATPESAEQVAYGRFLTEKYNCVSCHKIENNIAVVQQYYGKDELTTRAPPSLRGEGNKVHHGWLFNFLKNVEPLRPLLEPKGGIRMPSFHFTEGDDEVTAIAAYFAAVSNKEAQRLKFELDPVLKYIETAQKIEKEKIEKAAAQAKTGAAAGRDAGDPPPSAGAAVQGAGEAPTRADDAPAQAPPLAPPAEASATIAAAGGDWYRSPGLANNVKYLRNWALDREQIREIQLDETRNTEEELVKNYQTLLFKARFTANLYTAPYPFTDGAAPQVSQEDFRRGEQLFYEMQCLKCHIFGEQEAGEPLPQGVVAPNLALTHERLQRRWVRHWIQEPPIIQVGTAMPPFLSGLAALKIDGLSWPRSQGLPEAEAKRIEKAYGDTSNEQADLLLDFIYAAGARNYTASQPAPGDAADEPRPLPQEEPPTTTDPDSAGDPSVDSPAGAPAPDAPTPPTPPELEREPADGAPEEAPEEAMEEPAPDADAPAPADEEAMPEDEAREPAPKPASVATEEKPPARKKPAAAPQGAVAVKGKVIFNGEPPEPEELPVASSAECAEHHTDPPLDESLTVNEDGTLKNVFVRVTSGLPEGKAYPPPSEPAFLDQEGCIYHPHVLGIMTGQKLRVKNSDAFLHNVHSLATLNEAFNIAQPTKDPGKDVGVMKVPESFKIKCDVHPWMSAYVHVVEHPFFAVTGDDGTFSLHGLPPGTYTLSAWHETLGEQQMEITVEEGEPAEAEFTFEAEG